MICFAILAHANEEVLADQIENIKRFNHGCKMVLYNGGTDPEFGTSLSIPICPASKPLQKGKLGHFPLAVMRWLVETNESYDYLVFLDSDTLFVKPGYEQTINKLMIGYDCMGINMSIQHAPEDLPHWYPGQTMWAEWQRWQPFFGTDYFCCCLHALQLYRHATVHQMVKRLDFAHLETLIDSTDVFALEEMLLPTLAVRSGANYRQYPNTMSEMIRLGKNLDIADVNTALQLPDVYVVHPIERSMQNAARQWIASRQEVMDLPTKLSTLTISWGCFQGGVETALNNRLKALNRLGSESHAYFYYGGTGLNCYNEIPYAISNQRADLVAYLRRHTFHVVTFINTLYNLDVLNEVGYRGKVLFEFHGEGAAIFDELKRINEGQTACDIHAIVVPSRNVANIAKRYLTKRTDLPIYIAYNTLDTERFTNRDCEEFRYHYDIPDDWENSPLLGWVGRLDPNKNWRLLLRVFRKLRMKYKHDAKLLIASDLTNSPELNDFFRKAMHYEVMNDLFVLANVPYDKMPSFYSLIAQSGGTLLCTSYNEGYPYNLLEAQACHCPTIASNISGTREIVTHNVTGLSYPLSDNASLPALYVHQLITDKNLRRTVVQNARDLVCTKNDILANAQNFVRFLTDLFS
ncbi:MAG: glycosyltransferase family 4 protein [Tumebacillaceae bacterium]